MDGTMTSPEQHDSFPWITSLRRSGAATARQCQEMNLAIALGPEQTGSFAELQERLAGLPLPLLKLCWEASAFVAGSYLLVLASAEGFNLNSSDEIVLNRAFFIALSLYRTGSLESHAKLWNELSVRLALAGQQALHFQLRIEEAALLMNRGHYASALALVQDIGDHAAGIHPSLRLMSIRAICLQCLGHYGEALETLQRETVLVERLGSFAIRLGHLRRQISLAIESERYEDAKRLLAHATTLHHASPTSRALFLQQAIKLTILQGDHGKAEEMYNNLVRLLEEHRLSSTFVNLIEERCEIDLRKGQPQQVLASLQASLQEEIASGTESAECIARLYLARARLLLKDYAGARPEIERCISLATRNGYAKTAIIAMFYAAGCSYALGDRLAMESHLAQAGDRARALRLPVQQACHLYLQDLIREGQPRMEALFVLLRLGGSANELDHYLHSYAVLPLPRVKMRSVASGRSIQTEADLRHLIQRTRGVFWFPGDQRALVNVAGDLEIGEFSEKPELAQAFALLTERGKAGVTLEDLHHLQYPRVAFHPERHGSRCRSLVARLRKHVQAWKIDIVFDRIRRTYQIDSDYPLCSIEFLRAGTISSHLTPRQEAILAHLRSAGRATTAELCAALELTRQALHRHLRPLCDAGQIQMLGQGPATQYMLQQHEPGLKP